jgi:acyl carrier protein
MTTMTRDEIRQLVIRTLSDVAPEFDFATIAADKPLREQIDIDSFDFLNVIIRLHEKLKLDIPESDYDQLATLDGAVDYLSKKNSGSV